jgi:acetyl-CoA carboxylase biotin carboxyl carrier protein
MQKEKEMDVKDIKSLIKLITETDITEFELENAEEKIRIKRGSSPEISYYQAPPAMMQYPPPAQSQPSAPSTEAAAAISTPAPAVPETGKSITSPIVGTLYRASAPDAPPYVEEGQVVEKGHVLCIIEAMKLMNEIEAEYRCKIVKICKENAQPVEFGETLFIVEPM